jgi:hypothetical protein
VAKLLAGLAALAGLVWAWREFGRGWWRNLRRNAPGGDPVRLQAGRWLRELSEAGSPSFAEASAGRATPPYNGGGGETARVIGELQRLRFGARETWPEPEPVFRRARAAVRAERRRVRVE